MTPQLTNQHQPAHPDARINHVLEALRTTTPPAGLEQRIAARLAQAAEARQAGALTTTDSAAEPSIFTTIVSTARSAKSKTPRILLAPARLYATAAALTLLLTLTTITILHHHTPPTTASTTAAHTTPIASITTLTPTSNPSLERAGLQSRHNTPVRNAALAAEAISAPTQQPTLDTIALAETRAPSRPAPPMPLTAQEHLLLAAMRPGQPIEVAELDMARAPFLRAAAQSREDASIRRYVKTLLAPFAVTDALSPTTNSQPQESDTQAPAPQPSTSLTN